MSVYFIANIRINDADEYKKYIAGSAKVFERYNGKYITVDHNPTILEGNWNYSRLVMIEFPSRDALDAWYYSDEYQKILRHRLKAADCNTIIVESKE